MEENVNNNTTVSESIGLLKEIISEMDCRDKVRKYLDSLEIPDRFFACMFGVARKDFRHNAFRTKFHIIVMMQRAGEIRRRRG